MAEYCPICTNLPSPIILIRPPKYTICASCYEGARALVAMANKNTDTVSPTGTTRNPSKGFSTVVKWVKDLKVTAEGLKDEAAYLAGFAAAFRDQVHTDIQVKPRDGPCIPSHRALLAARSIVFKNMLDFDNCLAPQHDMVKLQELNYEELRAFLEFLYIGYLPGEKMEKHVYSLSMAADKYEVSFMQKFCEQHMLRTLSLDNTLDVLEISDTCSSLTLKDATLRFIVHNMDAIVFSSRFDEFALKNPHLSVQITRASCLETRKTC